MAEPTGKLRGSTPQALIVIAQIDPREYEPLELVHLEEFDQRKYGNTLLVFYERKETTE